MDIKVDLYYPLCDRFVSNKHTKQSHVSLDVLKVMCTILCHFFPPASNGRFHPKTEKSHLQGVKR